VQFLLLNDSSVFGVMLSMGGTSQPILLEKALKTISWDDLVLPKDIKSRGVDDQHKLPNYHYRDDGLAIWNATHSFVQQIVHLYYKKESDIKQDNELEQFITEAKKSLHELHNFPSSFTTFDQIIEFLTTIIWTTSCLSSLIENSHYDHLGWVPNAPGSVLKSAPLIGQTKEEDIIGALPTTKMASFQITTAWAMSQQAHESYLGKQEYFGDHEALQLIANFEDSFPLIVKGINEKNKNRRYPYVWLASAIKL